MSYSLGHGVVPPSIYSISSLASSQISYSPPPSSASDSPRTSTHLSQPSVSSARTQLPTLPPREAIDQGRAWVQPLGTIIFFPCTTTIVNPPFLSLSEEERENLFTPKGFLDPSRAIYLTEGQSYQIACFCRFSDVDCEPKSVVDRIMCDGNLPESHSPYIYYICKTSNCRCRWAMKTPTSQKDLKSLQAGLRLYENWETIEAETRSSAGIITLDVQDHHKFVCSKPIGGCGSEFVKCRRIEHECSSECKHLSKGDKGVAHKTSFFRYTCEICNFIWVVREPTTTAVQRLWSQGHKRANEARRQRAQSEERRENPAEGSRDDESVSS